MQYLNGQLGTQSDVTSRLAAAGIVVAADDLGPIAAALDQHTSRIASLLAIDDRFGEPALTLDPRWTTTGE